MLSLEYINKLSEKLNLINYQNEMKYMLRYQENTIFIFVKRSQITTNYCRIDFEEDSDDISIQFYNFDASRYENEKILIKKETLYTDLGLIINRSDNEKQSF